MAIQEGGFGEGPEEVYQKHHTLMKTWKKKELTAVKGNAANFLVRSAHTLEEILKGLYFV